MKKLFFIYSLLTLTLNAVSQNGEINKEKLDEKFGFRNIKLEKEFSSYPSLKFTKIEGDGVLNFYTLNSEEKKLGEIVIDKIVYVTINGKIAKIVIYTKGLANSDGLLAILQSGFGAGFKGNRYLNDYLWQTEKTTLFYSKNSVNFDGVAEIASIRLEREIKQHKEDKASKGASEF